jgi:hypothetical protein
MTAARLSGRGPGFHWSRGLPFLVVGAGSGWSGGVRYGVDALPGSDDLI